MSDTTQTILTASLKVAIAAAARESAIIATERWETLKEELRLQGRSGIGLCIHGEFVGGPFGPDFLCQTCEDSVPLVDWFQSIWHTRVHGWLNASLYKAFVEECAERSGVSPLSIPIIASTYSAYAMQAQSVEDALLEIPDNGSFVREMMSIELSMVLQVAMGEWT